MKRLIILVVMTLISVKLFADEQKPLYVVNNRVVSAEDVAKIAPTDIESMTVVKTDTELLVQYAELGDTSNGVIFIKLKSDDKADVEYVSIDVAPTFMGGDLTTFRTWVMQNIRYPKEAIEKRMQGRVTVKFIVDKEGYINMNRLNFFDKCGAVLHDEVIRVFEKSPRWTPGMDDGEPVAVSFILPIDFTIPADYVENTPAKGE